MPSINLTERYLQSLKLAPNQRAEIYDQGCPGLLFRASGATRSWNLRYRAANGRHARHRLGEYPTLDLRSARIEAGRLRDFIHNGGDPVLARQEEKERARQEAIATFGKLMEAYWVACQTGEWQPKRKKKRASTLAYEKRLAVRHIEPVLSHLPITAIRRATVKSLLRDMVVKGIGAQTNRVQALIRQIYNFAIAEELAEINPAMGFPSLHAAKPRQRIWKDAELRLLWRALSAPSARPSAGPAEIFIGPLVRIAIQLALLLLQRRNEITGMDVSELDLDQAVWLIPGERMKSGRPHQVPLPPYAVRLIREAIPLTGLPSDRTKGPVFPDPRDMTQPIKPSALTRAMDRMRDRIGVDDLTIHDLRRTGSTALTSERLRISPFIRSKVLGHESDAGGGSMVSSIHYDANEYMTDKRTALHAWEALLLHIVSRTDDGTARRQTGVIRGVMFGLEVANDTHPTHPIAFER